MRDEARREYVTLAVRAYAARMVADQVPLKSGEIPAFYEQEEELARRIMLADSLNYARRILEDADEDDLRLRDKWVTVDALALAAKDAHEEAVRFREEIGVPE